MKTQNLLSLWRIDNLPLLLFYASCSRVKRLKSLFLYHHSDRYGYVTTLKHSHPASQADAKGVHVTWMLAPFIKFRGVVSFFGPILPKIVHRDDSFTLKVCFNVNVQPTFYYPLYGQPALSGKAWDHNQVTAWKRFPVMGLFKM